jgi:hypothetical protein
MARRTSNLHVQAKCCKSRPRGDVCSCTLVCTEHSSGICVHGLQGVQVVFLCPVVECHLQTMRIVGMFSRSQINVHVMVIHDMHIDLCIHDHKRTTLCTLTCLNVSTEMQNNRVKLVTRRQI